MELDGQVAIVTGGAVRLGKALALALAEQGVRLAIHYGSSAGPAEAVVGQERAGHIVNIADWRGFRPGPYYMAYTLTKAAIIAMTKSLALALAPNIQVNAIAPGLILPPPGQDPAYLERKADQIPARRTGSPKEIANTLIYLLHSEFVTGDRVFVTGGEHL